ncbi:zinc ribbon domain-containing protein [Burkholderia sp. FERM BP-3421]|uniref:zinc ribbon domain-containing protein n=1 Tax=Burkholderia sp. FERM BP-3421 TaxID=1494466 RepID=UPI0023623C67|nr:zinc ribbon domain-containing protein [Burkholderia sp. FERM BP-3421]WDD95884.1 zinc ribbon domain-containing protein [Burkholderia sp. FERM BP-3421]
MSLLKWITGGHGRGHGGGFSRGHGGGHGGYGWGNQGGHSNGGFPPPSGSGPLQNLACARCGALNGAAAQFCSQCGVSQKPAACGKCSAALDAAARFCQRCGTQVA